MWSCCWGECSNQHISSKVINIFRSGFHQWKEEFFLFPVIYNSLYVEKGKVVKKSMHCCLDMFCEAPGSRKKIKFDLKECLSKSHLLLLYGEWETYAGFCKETAWKKLFSLKYDEETYAEIVKSVAKSITFNCSVW